MPYGLCSTQGVLGILFLPFSSTLSSSVYTHMSVYLLTAVHTHSSTRVLLTLGLGGWVPLVTWPDLGGGLPSGGWLWRGHLPPRTHLTLAFIYLPPHQCWDYSHKKKYGSSDGEYTPLLSRLLQKLSACPHGPLTRRTSSFPNRRSAASAPFLFRLDFPGDPCSSHCSMFTGVSEDTCFIKERKHHSGRNSHTSARVWDFVVPRSEAAHRAHLGSGPGCS